MNKSMPENGCAWAEVEQQLHKLTEDDIKWWDNRIAVFVFYPGDDVLEVAKK